jgi:hypothetical protein
VKVAACVGLPSKSEARTWHRVLDSKFLSTALSSTHTRTTPSRFNAGRHLSSVSDQYPILYFADTTFAAELEIGALLGSPYDPTQIINHPRKHFVALNIEVYLQDIIDLTDAHVLATLDTTPQEMTGDWVAYNLRLQIPYVAIPSPQGLSPTQELGVALNKTGIEGFLTASAKISTNPNLVVFPENMKHGSYLRFYDTSHTLIHEIAP